jgi:hypothetical protein
LRGETLTVAFKKPHVSLAESNLAVRSTDDVATQNSNWWCLLTKARTFFEENQVF